jgi:hypothetical protein
MDNIQKLIEALREVQSDFTALGQDRAFQGIVLTFANTLKARAGEFQELLPKAAVDRKIKNPVSIKALGGSEVRGGQTTSCPTCGKSSSVPPQQNTYTSGNILRLTKKVEQIAQEVFIEPHNDTTDYSQLMSENPLDKALQEAKGAIDDFVTKGAEGAGLTMEEAGTALSVGSQEGTGVSPVHFENPENILTGEPVIESNEWVAVLQEVKDVKQAKELYKAITGKGYPPRWPQELDQIAKAIWEARQNIEI